MRVITIYNDEKEEIVTFVRTFMICKGNQRSLSQIKQSNRQDFVLNTSIHTINADFPGVVILDNGTDITLDVVP